MNSQVQGYKSDTQSAQRLQKFTDAMKTHRKIGNDIRIAGYKPNGYVRNYVLSFTGLKGIKLPKVGGKSQVGGSTIQADLNFTLYYREPKG